MFKVIFVLILSNLHGGFDSNLTFATEQQCLTAKSVIQREWKPAVVNAICLEKQVPIKKMKCKIINDFSYKNHQGSGYPSSNNLDNYPYPTGFECVEE